MSRLDRFLVTDDWDLHFEGATQSLLPRPTFHHFPMLLGGGGGGEEEERYWQEGPCLLDLKTCG